MATRIFQDFSQAAEFARQLATGAGSCVPLAREGNLWLVGKASSIDADEYCDQLTDHEWLEEIHWNHVQYQTGPEGSTDEDWSLVGDDRDQADHEMWLGGPEDEYFEVFPFVDDACNDD